MSDHAELSPELLEERTRKGMGDPKPIPVVFLSIASTLLVITTFVGLHAAFSVLNEKVFQDRIVLVPHQALVENEAAQEADLDPNTGRAEVSIEEAMKAVVEQN